MLPLFIFAVSLLLSTLILLDGIAYFTFPLLPFKSFLLEIYSNNYAQKFPDVADVKYRTWLLDPTTLDPITINQELIMTDAIPEEPQFLIFTTSCLLIFGIAILYRQSVLRITNKLLGASPIVRHLEGLETDLDFGVLGCDWLKMVGRILSGPLIYATARFVSFAYFPDGKDYVTMTEPFSCADEAVVPSNNVIGTAIEEPEPSEPTILIPSSPIRISLKASVSPPQGNTPKPVKKVLLADIIPEIKKDPVVKTSRLEMEEVNRSLLFQQQTMFFC